MTEKEAEAISRLLQGEQLASKKARVYSKTLTDEGLAAETGEWARAHAKQFSRLLTMLMKGGEK